MTFQVPTSASVVGGAVVSAFAATLMDDAAASNARTTLGLGTFAVESLSACPAVTMAGNITLGGNLITTTNPTSATNILTAQFTGDSTNSPFRWMTLSATNPASNPRNNPTWCVGYNVHPSAIATNTSDQAFGMWLEGAYGAAGSEQVEWYLQGRGSNGTNSRPIAVTMVGSTGAMSVHLLAPNIEIGPAGNTGIVVDSNGLAKLYTGATGGNAEFRCTSASGIAGALFYNSGNAEDVIGTASASFVGAPFANNFVIYTNSGEATRDICLMARGSSARIRFMTGGTTERIGISTAGLLQFAGTSSSEPAIKRSTTILQARLADDSDYATYQGKLRVHANAVAETPTATHTVRVFDAAGTEYKVLCVAA